MNDCKDGCWVKYLSLHKYVKDVTCKDADNFSNAIIDKILITFQLGSWIPEYEDLKKNIGHT